MGSGSDLVVIGAGPTGLTLALQASMLGARVRVLEHRNEPRLHAPALAIHPRTMEVLRGIGVAEELLTRGLSKVGLEIHSGDTTITGSLGELLLPPTEFPFIFFAPQPEVEAVLRGSLSDAGINVEWGSTFQGWESHEGRIVSRVDARGREQLIDSQYLVGCDGAESTVRRDSGIRFRGRKYRESILVADVTVNGDIRSGTAHAFVGTDGILFLFPLPSGAWRLIGPGHHAETRAEVSALVEDHTNREVGLAEIHWIESVRPQHRLADTYRRGNVFLAGDAAHVHSPAGAQGMNTGIQDAANLGWKMGLAVRGAPDSLLDSYERERRPVAQHVVKLTGLAFALEVSQFPPLRWGRRWAARPAARLLLPHPRLVSAVARMVSGLDTRYRHGAIDDEPRSSRYRSGRRLPDLEIGERGARLHQPIDARTFHLLVFEDGIDTSSQHWTWQSDVVRIHELDPPPGSGRRHPAWVLVRPDGYIATSGEEAHLEPARRYLTRWLVDQPDAPKSTSYRSKRSSAPR